MYRRTLRLWFLLNCVYFFAFFSPFSALFRPFLTLPCFFCPLLSFIGSFISSSPFVILLYPYPHSFCSLLSFFSTVLLPYSAFYYSSIIYFLSFYSYKAFFVFISLYSFYLLFLSLLLFLFM